MNLLLQENIQSTLVSAVSATTTNVFYLQLASDEILNEFCVIYALSNISNVQTYNRQEVIKEYELRVRVQNPSSDAVISSTATSAVQPILDNSVLITNALYNLNSLNPCIQNVSLISEDMDYLLPEKGGGIYSADLRYNITYTF